MDKGKTIRPMKVRLYYSKTDETNCMSNILWDGKFPMSPKGFPSNHPVRIDGGTAFKKFREKYWASCFPEEMALHSILTNMGEVLLSLI